MCVCTDILRSSLMCYGRKFIAFCMRKSLMHVVSLYIFLQWVIWHVDNKLVENIQVQILETQNLKCFQMYTIM